jgi:hypothetical protein
MARELFEHIYKLCHHCLVAELSCTSEYLYDGSMLERIMMIERPLDLGPCICTRATSLELYCMLRRIRG